jgi:4-amino-4-deoxy-L-arabinose transferase-like glycosyltransferase
MALLTIATVLVTMRLGHSLYGPREGLVAGLLTLASLGTIEIGRSGMGDVPLFFLFTLAAWALWEALTTARPGWWGVFFAATGVSTLAKGPFSLILIALFGTLVRFAVRPRPLAALRHPLALAGLLVGVPAVVSWPLGLWRNELLGEWCRFFVVHENLGKFQDQYYPPSVLVEYLLVILFPWFPLVAAALWIPLRAGGYRDPRVALPPAWVAAVLVFHAVPATKLQHYVLPAMSGCALLVASAASRLIRRCALRGRARDRRGDGSPGVRARRSGPSAGRAGGLVAPVEADAARGRAPEGACERQPRRTGGTGQGAAREDRRPVGGRSRQAALMPLKRAFECSARR